MSARRRKLLKPRRLQVNIYRPSELRAWAKYWGCTQRDVREAVMLSGVMVMDVDDWLKVNVVLR